MACRCLMCGTKCADSNHVRNQYLRNGIAKDEDGVVLGAKNKKHSHKVLRTRMKRELRAELQEAS